MLTKLRAWWWGTVFARLYVVWLFYQLSDADQEEVLAEMRQTKAERRKP